VFTFAGSTHSNYFKYVLEMICDLEYESSPEFRKWFLHNWVVNLKGGVGNFMAGDMMQEMVQYVGEQSIGKKNQTYDSHYVADIVMPNSARFMDLKKELPLGVGLALKSGNHIEPHLRHELRELSSTFKDLKAHLFTAGRASPECPATNVDHFGRGLDKFDEKIKLFLQETSSLDDIPVAKDWKNEPVVAAEESTTTVPRRGVIPADMDEEFVPEDIIDEEENDTLDEAHHHDLGQMLNEDQQFGVPDEGDDEELEPEDEEPDLHDEVVAVGNDDDDE
jgi:hypothetical protein